ncbi:hypothetical protein OF820_12115 [Oceanotoga sp. DSM 15011]|jgi:hypothetical protein|uniref:Uncharacterized protein n=1 Tax=Oceanotoga teriensis TaxID=515440 RepID=A0AA45HIC9_9BACT|nr:MULTISPECIES: hypothetical protein [Oceanotoga]MDN5341799.1 hypothetical protein [Oceanotoga sp.]PWJ90540.1 hypothetical protein C7380_1128 [Oceanotoga teriensis]UYO99784.1 hypothetical protein OF820_12115 [Oceanotoga sp. DSM 15011]
MIKKKTDEILNILEELKKEEASKIGELLTKTIVEENIIEPEIDKSNIIKTISIKKQIKELSNNSINAINTLNKLLK